MNISTRDYWVGNACMLAIAAAFGLASETKFSKTVREFNVEQVINPSGTAAENWTRAKAVVESGRPRVGPPTGSPG